MRLNIILQAVLATAPALAQMEIKNAENPARTPVTRGCTVYLAPSVDDGTCSPFTVPAGKRLVIESATGVMVFYTTANFNQSYPSMVAIRLPASGQLPAQEIELEYSNPTVLTGQRRYFLTGSPRSYASAGAIQLRLRRTSPEGVAAAIALTVTGHLVDVQ